jgi:hypothetical protein
MDGGTSTPDNLQPLCRACHHRKTSSDIANGAGKRGPWAPRITILVGAPGAGKTTLARRHLAGNDLVYDYDALVSACSCIAPWTAEGLMLAPILRRVRDAIIGAAIDGHVQGRVWVLMSDLTSALDLTSTPGVDLLILHPGIDACVDAIRARRLDPDRERDACLAASRFDATLRALLNDPTQPLRAATLRRQREDDPRPLPQPDASGAIPAAYNPGSRVPRPQTVKPDGTPRPRRHKRARPGSPPFPPPPLEAAPLRTAPPAPFR